MTPLLFALTGIAAVADWAAVALRLYRLEYLLKPLTTVLLILAALSADFPTAKGLVVLGLALALVGDVALLFAPTGTARMGPAFVLGLGAFLAGHLCYLAAFVDTGLHAGQVIGGLLIVIGIAALALPGVLLRVYERDGRTAGALVAGYAVVVAAMAVFAIGTAILLTALGGILFLLSDAALARNHFAHRLPYGEVIVIVTYHLAQVLIVIGLVAA